MNAKSKSPYTPKGKLRKSIRINPFVEQMKIVTQPLEICGYVIYGYGETVTLLREAQHTASPQSESDTR